MPLALFIAYPLLAHTGVLLAQPLLQALALCCLYAGVFYAPLRQRQVLHWLGFAAYTAIIVAVTGLGGGVYALYLPPLAMTALACAGFARSLRPAETPIVTRIAEAVHGRLEPQLRAHTRRVTVAWVVVLATLFLITLGLSVLDLHTWWSWMTNVINYLVLGAMFVLDYAYRRWRFPDHDREGFVGHLRQVIRGGRATRKP